MAQPESQLKTVETVRSGSSDRAYVTVKSQITLIRMVAFAEIAFGIITLFGQTVAIAFSHEFATRSLTGIWTSWFFLTSAGTCLFWSTRCTFNGLLAVLVIQIISATMGIPLFTSSCLLFGVYPFRWSLSPEDGSGAARITSSIAILVTNLIMMLCSIVELILNGYNAYNCYFLAYGETKEEVYEYDEEGNVGIGNRSGKNPATAEHRQAPKQNTQSSSGGRKSAPNTSGSNTNWNQPNSNQNRSTSNPNQTDDWGQDEWGGGGGYNYNQQYNNTNNQQYNNGNDDDDWGSGPVVQNSGAQSSVNQNNGGKSSGNQKRTPAQNHSTRTSTSYNKQAQKVNIRTSSTAQPFVKYEDPAMPQPPPDLTIAPADIITIKYCGVTGVFLAFLIFCSQTAMFALANEPGVNIGIGIWGALYYIITGIITVYNGLKPTGQSSVSIFILQTLQFVISVPLVGISYYILAVFGSCTQADPVPQCPGNIAAGISMTCLGGVMALSGTVMGLTSLTLMLICSQTICGTTRCMISGSSVYPTL